MSFCLSHQANNDNTSNMAIINNFSTELMQSYDPDKKCFIEKFELGGIKSYDAISNCKSAGVIPYCIYNNTVYFLFQKEDDPCRQKNDGWNDFGGKKNAPDETTYEVAAREFSEETSCLFYLKQQNDHKSYMLYQSLKNNDGLIYSDDDIEALKKLIPTSQKYFHDKISEYALPINLSSKEIYISYFIKVDHIPDSDLPKAEDIHVPYDDRYLRTCKWFSFEEINSMDEKQFHKRLQITKIIKRIRSYYDKNLFT